MATFIDNQAAARSAGLETAITQAYREALIDATNISSTYWARLEERERELIADIDRGKVQIPKGYTKDEYLAKWRENNVGRGERWETLRQEMAWRMTNANLVASAYINDTTPGIYSLYHNFSAYQMEQDVNLGRWGNVAPAAGVSYTLINEQAVKRLIYEDVQLFPKPTVDIPKDLRWNMNLLQKKLTSGVLLGYSIDKIAKSFQDVAGMNQVSAVRNARTATTGAMNAGMMNAYKQAQELYGIKYQKEWMAASDERTRESHVQLNGVRVAVDDRFPNGCEYPGDSNGLPREVYNCRCRMRRIIPGLNDNRLRTNNTVKSYNEWLQMKEEQAAQRPQKTKTQTPTFPVDALHPATIAGVARGNEMTYEEADNYGTNPNYGSDRSYAINCQTCVIANEARRRGYDVIAKGNTRGSKSEHLSRRTHHAFLKPNGEYVDYIFPEKVLTPKKYAEWLEGVIGHNGERYTFEFLWKRGGGHIVNMDRDEYGKIRVHDEQRGVGERKLYYGESLVDYLGRMSYYRVDSWTRERITSFKARDGEIVPLTPAVMRIDDAILNPEYVDDVLEGAKK